MLDVGCRRVGAGAGAGCSRHHHDAVAMPQTESRDRQTLVYVYSGLTWQYQPISSQCNRCLSELLLLRICCCRRRSAHSAFARRAPSLHLLSLHDDIPLRGKPKPAHDQAQVCAVTRIAMVSLD